MFEKNGGEGVCTRLKSISGVLAANLLELSFMFVVKIIRTADRFQGRRGREEVSEVDIGASAHLLRNIVDNLIK